MSELKLLHVVVPADLLDRVYAAAEAEGVTMAVYVAARLEAALEPKRRRSASKQRRVADK